jgi:hypothetical protein
VLAASSRGRAQLKRVFYARSRADAVKKLERRPLSGVLAGYGSARAQRSSSLSPRAESLASALGSRASGVTALASNQGQEPRRPAPSFDQLSSAWPRWPRSLPTVAALARQRMLANTTESFTSIGFCVGGPGWSNIGGALSLAFQGHHGVEQALEADARPRRLARLFKSPALAASSKGARSLSACWAGIRPLGRATGRELA